MQVYANPTVCACVCDVCGCVWCVWMCAKWDANILVAFHLTSTSATHRTKGQVWCCSTSDNQYSLLSSDQYSLPSNNLDTCNEFAPIVNALLVHNSEVCPSKHPNLPDTSYLIVFSSVFILPSIIMWSSPNRVGPIVNKFHSLDLILLLHMDHILIQKSSDWYFMP